MPRTLTIGCTLPTSGVAADTSTLRGLAQIAEDVGFDSIWLSDHVVVPERIASSYPYSPDGRFPTMASQPYFEPLRAEAERVGRDPTKLRTCFSTTVTFDPPADPPADTPERPFSGSVSEIAAEFDRYIQVGVDSFIVGFGSRQPAELKRCLQRFAEQVRPVISSLPANQETTV